jgi:hypothetical protein
MDDDIYSDMRFCARCDQCREIHRFDTPVTRSRFATDHFQETQHRIHAYDERRKSGLIIPLTGK